MNETTNVTVTISLAFNFRTDRTDDEARLGEPASGFMVVTNRKNGATIDELYIDEREVDTAAKRARMIQSWLSDHYPAQ